MMQEFNRAFYKGLGLSLGVVTGIEAAVVLLAVFFLLDSPRFRIVQFKRYSENLTEGESSHATGDAASD